MDAGPNDWLKKKWGDEGPEKIFASDLTVLGVTQERFDEAVVGCVECTDQDDDGDEFYDQKLLDALTVFGKRLREQKTLPLSDREEGLTDRVLDQMLKENRQMVRETQCFMGKQ